MNFNNTKVSQRCEGISKTPKYLKQSRTYISMSFKDTIVSKKYKNTVLYIRLHPIWVFRSRIQAALTLPTSHLSPPPANMLQQLHFGNIVARAVALSCVSAGRISRLLHTLCTVHPAVHICLLLCRPIKLLRFPSVAPSVAPIRCSRTTITE